MVDKLGNIQLGLMNFFESYCPSYNRLSINKLVEITSGWETELYTFNLQYYEKEEFIEKNLVIRMYPGNNATRKQLHEHFIYSKLLMQNYPVPNIHYGTSEDKFVGKPFIIMDKIEGKTLLDFVDPSSEESLKLFSKLFVELHTLDWKLFIDKDENSTRQTSILSIENFLETMNERIKEFELYELNPILNWLNEKKKNIKEEILALNHHDFHHFNILIDQNGSPFVIDWATANIRDFRFDLGWTLLLTYTYSTPELRNMIFNAYQETANKSVDNIVFFEVAAILRRLSDILSTFKYGPDALGMHDEVIPMMLEDIDSILNTHSYLYKLANIKIPEFDAFIKEITK